MVKAKRRPAFYFLVRIRLNCIKDVQLHLHRDILENTALQITQSVFYEF